MNQRYAYDFFFKHNKKEVWNYQTLHAYCTASIQLNLSENIIYYNLGVGSSSKCYMLLSFVFGKTNITIFFRSIFEIQ